MIDFFQISNEIPYRVLKQEYDKALNANQNNIEAICISSYSKNLNEVNSRFVNLKMINHDEFIFFTNYESPKAQEFTNHDQISASFFWSNTNVQIRMKARIKKTSNEFNNSYFAKRNIKKNALAISSNQSCVIDSYEDVKKNFSRSLDNDNLEKCPDYWGGYSFSPYYFEFWEGHMSRLNKRIAFKHINGKWSKFFLQP